MRTPRTILVACVIAFASGATSASADVVTYWNDIAVTNINAAGRFPGGLIDVAEMHLAIHDAVQAYEDTAEPYCVDIENASGAVEAAVARAARDVLIAQLPAAQDVVVEAAYQAYLATNSLVGNAGLAIGAEAAACILAVRAGDGSFPNPAPTFYGGAEPGEWRPTTPAPTSMVQPWLGSVMPFALKDSSQLRAEPGPPSLTSGRYTRDYDEVKLFGAKNSTVRTADQTELAYFYSDNLAVLMERTLRTIVETYAQNLGESARAMALANAAAADAIIGAWNTKLAYHFWRPISAVREGDNDGNDFTVGDPTWEPLITTPNYPDYTSGANNLAASITRTLEHVFHSDRLSFVVETKAAAAQQKFRWYDRLSDVCRDVIDVRIYQGIHFRFADEGAYRTGIRAADWAVSHILKPTGGS